jgi:hypothetical protein
MAWRLQHFDVMSVKTMLPLLGVGSAFAILGLCAARRPARSALGRGLEPREQRMQSGVHPRVSLDDADAAELAALAPELTSDFWDASPDSSLLPDSYGRPPSEIEAYDALDPEDLSAEWLTRATEAPARSGLGELDLDDPAEIAADSMSMISDASRHAAALDLDDLDEPDEASDRAADSRV